MNRKEHLLVIISEECSEIQKQCSKHLRFGDDESKYNDFLGNDILILREFNDLVATLSMYYRCDPEKLLNIEEIIAKRVKIEKYFDYSKERGRLDE